MATYDGDAKNLMMLLKAYVRANPLPLDATEVYETLADAQTYAKAANAYAGQTIKVKNSDGKYDTYVLNGVAGAYTLDKVGLDASAVKNYVQVVEALPESGQEQGVIYVNTTDAKGYIYDGSAYKVIFEDVTTEDGKSLADQLAALDAKFDEYAALAGATFTGPVVLSADPSEDLGAATKQYVDRLVAGINSFTVGIVDSTNPLPTSDYTVGQTYRVTEAGTYAGQTCEPGDLIVVVKDFDTTAADADFLVIQSNISGAVSGPDASTDANLAAFDGITGKKLADSALSVSSVSDAVSKAHEHANKDVLDTYDKTQAELLAAAKEAAAADVTTTLEDYYTKSEIDTKEDVLEASIATKVTSDEVSTALSERIGEIPDTTTVKSYIDTAVGSGGTASAEAIAAAKQEAIETSQEYTNTALTITEF